jgi:hypothetical protein
VSNQFSESVQRVEERPETRALKALQPALRSRDPRRFHAIARTQLADRLRKLIPHRAIRQAQLPGDIAAGHAFACQPQHMTFAVPQPFSGTKVTS